MTEPIRVLVVDDHQIVRQGLRTFLGLHDDLLVVGEAADGVEAVDQVLALQPDVVLLDLQLPHLDGVGVLHRLREAGAGCRVLVLTSFTDEHAVLPAVRAGAAGYLLKDVDPQALAQAIRTVHAGQVLFAAEIAGRLLTGPPPEPAGELTDREGEVLRALARGMSNREIARSFGLSEKTVKTHVSSVLSKLRLKDRTQAALYAVHHGLTGD